MSKRVRLTNDSLNSYGYRVLTAGVDMTLYEKNPVLLYMHERGLVIGTMTDLRNDGNEISGVPEFDCASDLSRQCKKQWEAGSLRMVSIGFDIIETSDAPEHLVAGQTRPTVTRSKLYEVSIVDIGANSDAIVLRKDGKLITLGDSGDCPLPLLNNKPTNTPKQMELKTLALQLGLPETADEAAVNAKLAELNASAEEAAKMRKENEDLKLAQITAAVDGAIESGKITAVRREHFINVGRKLGIDDLNATLEAMAPAGKLSALLQPEPADDKNEKMQKGPWEQRMDAIREKLNKQ